MISKTKKMENKKYEIVENKEEITTYTAVCPFCGKSLKQNYLSQLENNMDVHIYNCKENPNNIEDAKKLADKLAKEVEMSR